MSWRSSPAATELEQLVLDWLAELLGLPAGLHGHIEDTASTSTARRARRRPHAPARRRRLRLGAREHLGREGGAPARARVPDRAGRRRVPDAAGALARRCDRGGRDRGHDLLGLDRSRGRARAPVRGRRRLAPRRRGLRRRGGGVSGAALVPRRRRPRRLARRQPSQVALHAHGLLDPLDASPRCAAGGVLGPRRLPRSERRRARPARLRARRWDGASARSSSGRCCAATAATACRR